MVKPSNYAARLQAAREAVGLQQYEVADRSGIERSAYLDLESYDDEIRMGVSAREVAHVLACLNLSPYRLFGEPTVEDAPPATYVELARAIEQYLAQHDLSAQVFEERAGWEIREGLRDPDRLGDLTLDALSDVSELAGFDWRRLLVESAAR